MKLAYEKRSELYSGSGNPMYGKTFDHTEETKQKISKGMKGKNSGKNPWNKGMTGYNRQPHTEESKQKIKKECFLRNNCNFKF